MKSRMSAHAMMRRIIADNMPILKEIGGMQELHGSLEGSGDIGYAIDLKFAVGKNLDRFNGDGVTMMLTEYSLALDLFAYGSEATVVFQVKYACPTVPSDVDRGIPIFCDLESCEQHFRKAVKKWDMSKTEIEAGLQSLRKIHTQFHKIDTLYTGHMYDENLPRSGVYFDPLRVLSGM
ncbi:hypothetical protein RYA05_02790 [Pseudomonas syringae pv. actinidiae]|nr:hypothetical protein [Pseudomonas syringae pv. actinidiae]